MRKLLHIIPFIFLINILNSAELIKVNREDLTEFEDSAFVKLMNNFNGGEIPYPFSKLLDSFGTGLREEGNILFVPKGRSLVKEYADYHNPRIIVEPIGKEASSNRIKSKKNIMPNILKTREENRRKISELGIETGDLYIGFAPNHKALEIISYNPKKAKYDFFIIKDYESGKTPIIVSNPAQCLSCHQNEGPIFPRGQWHELAGDTADSDNFEDTNVEIMNRIRKANPEREEIEGINLEKKHKERFSFSQIIKFDNTVRQSNQQTLKNQVCEALCSDKKTPECQKKLLQFLLEEKTNLNSDLYFKNIEQKVNAINLKSSVIPDRNPDTNEGFQHYIPPGLDFDEHKGFDSTFSEVNLADRVETVNDDDFVNPATARPINSDLKRLQGNIKKASTLHGKIIFAIESCLPTELIKKSIKDNNASIDVLLNDPEIIESLKAWPNTRKTVALINIKSQKNSPSSINLGCEKKLPSVIPVYKYSNLGAVIEKFNNDKIKKPEALFGKYCMQCHGGQTPFIPLPLDSAEKMANYIPHFGKTGVEERLTKKTMPPPFAELQPTDEERTDMVKLMKELKK